MTPAEIEKMREAYGSAPNIRRMSQAGIRIDMLLTLNAIEAAQAKLALPVANESGWTIDHILRMDARETTDTALDLLARVEEQEARIAELREVVKAILDGYGGKVSDVYGEAIQAMHSGG